jgi:ATP-dependent DNA helicase RecQ
MPTKRKSPSPRKTNPLQAAARKFGFEQFRPGQREAIDALTKGRDCLVVMPTGSGKSAIYQVAGLLLEGVTVVISPLIALQKDQVDSINQAEVPEAVVVNSSQRVAEARRAIEAIEEGSGKYIFLAPEQLRRQETLETLENANVSLFVVDEAHCISEWGHDFRPDYLQLGAVIEKLGRPPVLAMTATAAPQVRQEIAQRLGMRRPKVLVHGFDRPNIYLRVDRFEEEGQKLDALLHRVNWSAKPGIVYVATRKNVDLLTGALVEQGVNAAGYHGGMRALDRRVIQDRFMAGETDVMVATNAFGMGIDKPDVRFVFHYEISDSLDSYYQEIGRAGRDGEKAEAVLFFRQEDMGVRRFLNGEAKLDTAQLESLAGLIADQEGPVSPAELAVETDLSERKLTRAIHRLADAGALEVLPGGDVELKEDASVSDAAQAAAEDQQHFQKMKQERLEEMQRYADSTTCRREQLLRHFGDKFKAPCGNCDNCERFASKDSGDIQIDPALGTRREVA